MSEQLIDILDQTRGLLYGAVARLAQEQWFTVPEGFDNNIAWNVGHIIGVQQSLIYRLSGVETYTSSTFFKQFAPGTSPADWHTNPDIDELKTMLKTHVKLLREDFRTGKFQQYHPYETSTGVKLASIEDGIAFNTFHEGLHLGAILALRNLL